MTQADFIPHDGSETDLIARVLVAITALPGAMFWRNNTGQLQDKRGRWVSFGTPGSGDILGCLRGRAISIETKVGKGKQRETQKSFEWAWKQAGGLYILTRSVEHCVYELRGLNG